jgi:RHS repeat-associated protein
MSNARTPVRCLTRFIAAVAVALGTSHASPQTVTYYHNDAAGSPMVATDASGAVVWKETYRPYGERVNNPPAEAGNSIGFAGRPYDAATGLSYAGARYYDPGLGRFLAVDPAVVDPERFHGINRYAYAENNPHRYVDPDSHTPVDVLFLGLDLARLSVAIYKGQGIGDAARDVAFSAVGVISPIPATGQVLKAARVAQHAVEAARIAERRAEALAKSGVTAQGLSEKTTVIGRVGDLKKVGEGEQTLLDRLPYRGDAQSNWRQNAGVLREEMQRGLPIRDASWKDNKGQFLNAERNLLKSHGWELDKKTHFWMPPTGQ